MSIAVRRAGPGDLKGMEALCEVESHILEKHWGPYDLPRMFERSADACCATDEKGNIVGFAFFHHYPVIGDFKPATWLEELTTSWSVEDMADLDVSTSLVLSFFYSEHLFEEEVLLEITKMAFVVFHEVERIFLFIPAIIPLFTPLIGNFEPLVSLHDRDSHEAPNVSAYCTSRRDYMGTMLVRSAMVEDHDDLMPIFRAQQANAETLGDYFLAHLIQSQDDTNKALVAEADGRAIGLLSVTADVQLGPLQEAFDLAPYDFLVRDYSQAAVQVHKDHVALISRLQAEHADRIENARREARRNVEEEFQAYLREKQEEEEQDDEGHQLSEEEVGLRKEREKAELAQLIQEAEDEVMIECGEFVAIPEPPVDLFTLKSNALCVTLFCMDPLYDCQVHRILAPAFELFPDMEYCILLAPHTAPRNSLMRLFLPVKAKLGQNFTHALHMCHRASLLRPLVVRPFTTAPPASADFARERSELNAFLGDDVLTPDFLAAVDNRGGDTKVYIARILDQIVAVACVKVCKAPALYTKYYELDRFMQPSHYGSDEHLELETIVINHIFAKSTRDFIRQLQRLTGTACTYALLPPDPPVQEGLTFMTFIPPRRQQPSTFPPDIDPAKTGLSRDLPVPLGYPSLHYTNFHLETQSKTQVDTRLVIVGTSDAAMALLQTIAAVPYLQFLNIAVVAQGGLPRKTPAFRPDPLNFTGPERLWHGVASSIQVIEGTLGSLDRAGRSVTVDLDDAKSQLTVQYDLLVLAPGLRDTFIDRLRKSHGLTAGLYAPFNDFYEGGTEEFIANSVAGRQDAACVVYGSSLSTLVSVARLLELGIDGSQVTVVSPSKVYQPIGDERACEIALLAAARAGVSVLEGRTIEDVEVRTQRITAVVLDDGQILKCTLLLSHTEPGIDPKLFSALNDQSLVLDGKLVVDGSFRTNDAAIFAGGDLVKLARRMQDSRRMERFNQKELGERLGEALLVDLDPNASQQPLGESGKLPGGLYYYYAWASPGLFPMGSLEQDTARDLVTEVPLKTSYSRLIIDKYGRVASVCFLLDTPLKEAWTIRALVGLPVTYLNDLVGRVDRGQMLDIKEFLYDSEWARALYHDRFAMLRHQLELGAETSPYMSAVVKTLWERLKAKDPRATSTELQDTILPGEARSLVQQGLNHFLEFNSDHLPVYITAVRAQEMGTGGKNIWAQTSARVGLVVGDVPLMDNTV